MIVKILSSGASFKGLATYLTHDPKAKTDERVAWTHTLNLAHDHVPSAVDEMLMTARNAELLKQESGIRAGGRATENPVKHLSLNWAPDENPMREHMIETAEGFLRHMNWHERQAIFVAHDDKEHAHVHIMLNAVHPETGLHLDDGFERRRAQAWALAYEQEQGRIYCEQRLHDPEQREDAPTRPAWMAFEENRKEFEREEKLIQVDFSEFSENRENSQNPHAADWKRLKEIQRRERMDFFADGKTEFSELRREIYREIRADFSDRWADFYAAKKSGADEETLAALKKEIVAEQKMALETRRDQACQELRDARDARYHELLSDQLETRHAMRLRQEAGLDNELFLTAIEARGHETRNRDDFRDHAEMVTAHRNDGRNDAGLVVERSGRVGLKSGADVGSSIATGLGFGVLSIFESIADGLIGAKPAPRPRRVEPDVRQADLFDSAAIEASRRQQQEREDDEADWRKRQRSLEGD